MASSKLLGGLDESVTEIVSEDVFFEALADATRQHVLAVCYREGEPVEVGTLARVIADRRVDELDDGDLDEVSRRVRITIHHLHGPKLAAANLVDFDAANGTIAPTHDDPEVVSELRAFLPNP